MRYSSSYREVFPENPFYMVGYVSEIRKKPALGVVDVPNLVGTMLEVENEIFLFVSYDVCILKTEQVDEIKSLIMNKFGNIKRDNITLTSIHTHSGPDGLGMSYPDPHPNIKYLNKVKNETVSCISEMLNSLQEVEVYFGKGKCTGYYNNRNDATKPYDDELTVIQFKSKEQIIGAMVSVSCHSTVLGEKNRYCTYDLLGSIRELMKRDLGVMPYVFMSSAGDVSNRNFRQGNDFNELKRVSNGVYDQIKSIQVDKEIVLSNPSIEIIDHRICYNNKKYFELYERQLKDVNEVLKLTENPLVIKLKESEKKKLEIKLTKDKVDFHVISKVIKLGDLSIITFPGELVSKFGIELKDKAPGKCSILMTCADNHLGYFVEKEYYWTIYETIASYIPKGEVEKIVEEIKEKL